MKSISGKSLCKIVEERGWILQRINCCHHIYQNSDFDKILSIPVHSNQDLKIGTLRALMKIADLVEEDLT